MRQSRALYATFAMRPHLHAIFPIVHKHKWQFNWIATYNIECCILCTLWGLLGGYWGLEQFIKRK